MTAAVFTLCAGWCLRSISGEQPTVLLDCVAWLGMLAGGIRMGMQLGL